MVPVWLLLTADHVLGAMVGCAILGVAIERFAYRPLRDAPRIAPLISALGVSFLLANSMQLMFGAQQRDYGIFTLDGGSLYLRGFDIGDVHIPLIRIITISSAFVADGRALAARDDARAPARRCAPVSFDREAAAMMGIDIDRVIVFTFVLGSALAGAAGVMFALRVPTAASIGFLAGLKGFTAAVIGGIGSIPGAMAGRPDPRPRRGLHRRLLDDDVVRSRDLHRPDRVHAVPAERPASAGRASTRYERAAPGPEEAAVRARDRAGRVGRAARRAPLAARRADRQARGAPASRAVVGVADRSSSPRFVAAAGRLRQRLHPRVAFDTHAVHAARARTQRRRRLGRPARPRLRGVLRRRRLRLRDAQLTAARRSICRRS